MNLKTANAPLEFLELPLELACSIKRDSCYYRCIVTSFADRCEGWRLQSPWPCFISVVRDCYLYFRSPTFSTPPLQHPSLHPGRNVSSSSSSPDVASFARLVHVDRSCLFVWGKTKLCLLPNNFIFCGLRKVSTLFVTFFIIQFLCAVITFLVDENNLDSRHCWHHTQNSLRFSNCSFSCSIRRFLRLFLILLGSICKKIYTYV